MDMHGRKVQSRRSLVREAGILAYTKLIPVISALEQVLSANEEWAASLSNKDKEDLVREVEKYKQYYFKTEWKRLRPQIVAESGELYSRGLASANGAIEQVLRKYPSIQSQISLRQMHFLVLDVSRFEHETP